MNWKIHVSHYLGTLQKSYLLTHSTVQSPSWAADWLAASQEIPRISRNPNVHYRTHKRTPPVPILGQPNPVHMPTSHLLEIHPNIIHLSRPRSPRWCLSLRFPHQEPIHPPLLIHTRHMPSPSLLEHKNIFFLFLSKFLTNTLQQTFPCYLASTPLERKSTTPFVQRSVTVDLLKMKKTLWSSYSINKRSEQIWMRISNKRNWKENRSLIIIIIVIIIIIIVVIFANFNWVDTRWR